MENFRKGLEQHFWLTAGPVLTCPEVIVSWRQVELIQYDTSSSEKNRFWKKTLLPSSSTDLHVLTIKDDDTREKTPSIMIRECSKLKQTTQSQVSWNKTAVGSAGHSCWGTPCSQTLLAAFVVIQVSCLFLLFSQRARCSSWERANSRNKCCKSGEQEGSSPAALGTRQRIAQGDGYDV